MRSLRLLADCNTTPSVSAAAPCGDPSHRSEQTRGRVHSQLTNPNSGRSSTTTSSRRLSVRSGAAKSGPRADNRRLETVCPCSTAHNLPWTPRWSAQPPGGSVRNGTEPPWTKPAGKNARTRPGSTGGVRVRDRRKVGLRRPNHS